MSNLYDARLRATMLNKELTVHITVSICKLRKLRGNKTERNGNQTSDGQIATATDTHSAIS